MVLLRFLFGCLGKVEVEKKIKIKIKKRGLDLKRASGDQGPS